MDYRQMKSCFTFILLSLLSLSTFAVDKVNILALFRDKAILEIDGSRHTLTAGDTTASGVTLISATSKEALLEIDGVQQTYTLGVHIGSNYATAGPGVVVSIAPDSQGMYMVNGTINRHQVRFVVDTGATLIMMNRREAARFGIDYKLTGQKSPVSTASGAGMVYVVNLTTVKVGDITMSNVAAGVSDSDFPEIILLGNSFLNNVSMKRDGQLLQLSK